MRVRTRKGSPSREIVISPNLLVKLSPYLVYIIYTLYSWKASQLETHLYAGDFQFYFKTSYEFWGRFTSEYADHLYNEFFNINPDKYNGWVANPIYSIIALAPITVFGSKLGFALLGFVTGLFNISLIRRLCTKLAKENRKTYSKSIGIACSLIYTIYPNFSHNTLCLTTNGIYCTFILLMALAKSNRSMVIFGIMAVCIRPNSIYFLGAAIIAFIAYKPVIKNNNLIKTISVLSIVSTGYIIFYFTHHSTYPSSGNIVVYFIYPFGQNFDIGFEKYANEFILKTLNAASGVHASYFLFSEESAISMKLLVEKWLFLPEAHYYIINLYFLKLQALLGYTQRTLHDVFTIDSYWHRASLDRIIYFLFILPGFMIGIKKIAIDVVNVRLRSRGSIITAYMCCNSISILYILISALSIGFPRYQLPFSIIFIYNTINAISYMYDGEDNRGYLVKSDK